ncbi:MAG: serine hydrolase domain-containing protein [Candidatus Wallacebacter cryptica]|nr:serine hydrolase [Bacillota bacterium]
MAEFFPKASPESVGICSQSVMDFFDRLEANDVCMHSVLIIRDGKLAVETYYHPYQADTLHRMFSVTKSFTSLAIGLLVEEGRISLDDKIIDYFPEKLPAKGVHPYTAKITIRNMLMMATAHAGTTYKRTSDPDWVKSYFTVPPTHLPGTLFHYDTSASHTLCGLVEKLTGMPLLDYLRTKFLDEIGFSKDAYILHDPVGVSMGGSGLMSTPLDLAKVAWIVMNGGEHNGKQYLPREYLAAAVTKQIDTAMRGNNLDEKLGYGYQFWRVRNNGFGMLGMGGQQAVCFPEHNLLLVTTADTQEDANGVPAIFDAFFETVYQNLSAEPLAENPEALAKLEARLAGNSIKALRGVGLGGNQDFAAKINEREYVLDANRMKLKSLKLSFDFDHNEGTLWLTNHLGTHALRFGIEKLVLDKFPYYNYRAATSGSWRDERTLLIKCHIVDYDLGSVTIKLGFKDDAVTVAMRKIVEFKLNEFNGLTCGKVK